ncbi:MAG: NADH-quinone oxidoreductase subunit NuoG [Candidatus Zixiibacteriota bacterium]|nr:MAG: NADH-quinone oxidoreductase subunit NuoG [candidate division Zixibacteria bacterium]
MAEATKKDMPTETAENMVTLTINGRETTVPKGTTVLQAAKELGVHIPTFCWHPKLKPVGACRMCYVEVEKMPKLQVSCALEVMDGMVVHTDSDTVKQGRKAIIEFILLNHPLDCPTCDKGGECDLQNLTFAHGVDDSRFEFQKYRFVDEGMTTTFDDRRIGPEIILNRNRCILCYKCVRANKEAFGEYDLGVYERGSIAEINAAPGEQVDNPFSGNLVEICPVGALTNSDWRYKIRVWLTSTTPSICNYTSSGINTLFFKENHHNKIYRVTSRPSDDIDDGWLPDVTRYGYQIVNSPDRLTTPLVKKEGKQVEATWEEALEIIGKRFGEIKERLGGVCVGALVSPGLDNASLHAASRLMRVGFKSNNIDFRGDYRYLPESSESPFMRLCSRPFKIADIDDSDVIVTFGSDLIREHANEYLRIRKAFNFGNARIFAVNPYQTKSADVSSLELVYLPGTEESVVNGICLAAIEDNLVDAKRGEKFKLKTPTKSSAEAAKVSGVDRESLRTVAEALAEGKKITFFTGEIITRSRQRDLIASALINLHRLFGLKGRAQMSALARYANSKGAEKLGLLPNPRTVVVDKLRGLWGEYPESPARNTDAMMALIKKEEIKGFLILGSNPVMLYPDREFVKEGIEKLDFLVVADLFETETTELADVVLPLASWAEYEGYYVNLEGRTQKAARAVKPIGQAKPGYEIASLIGEALDPEMFQNEQQIHSEVRQLLELDSVIAYPDDFLEVKADTDGSQGDYNLPLYIIDDWHHSGHLTEKAPSLANFASEPYIEIPPQLASELKIAHGDSVRVESEVGKVILPARISEHTQNNVVLVPRNFSSSNVTSLLMRKKRVDRVKISKVDE